jgi:hypothetical protein
MGYLIIIISESIFVFDSVKHHIYCQLNICIKFGNSWIPVCYALLPDKCKETYFAAFYMVRKQIQDMKLSFNVQSMRSDFEIGEMKAAAAAWDIVVKGCYYHFTQSGWRFVQNNGMASAYLSDSDQEFKLLVKCILSLPHVPVQDIDETLGRLPFLFFV